MSKRRPAKSGPKAFVLKVEGDFGAGLDRLLGKGGSSPPRKKGRKRSAKRKT